MASKKVNEKNIFRVIIGVLNVCLLIGLVGYLVYVRTSKAGLFSKSNADIIEEYDEEQLAEAVKEADDDMFNIYGILIQGASANIGNDLKMSFHSDGTYEGFFDSEHQNITDGSYEIVRIEDTTEYAASVQIYNKDKVSYVSYMLKFNEADGSMELYYPQTGESIPLEF